MILISWQTENILCPPNSLTYATKIEPLEHLALPVNIFYNLIYMQTNILQTHILQTKQIFKPGGK